MTATRGWSLLAAGLVLAGSAATEVIGYEFLLHPEEGQPVATYTDEFDHPVGERLIDTAAPTKGKPPTPWMGSDTFIIAEDTQFGTGNAVTRSGILGDFTGNGRTDQADLDLVLMNWGASTGPPPPPNWTTDPGGSFIDQGELDAVLSGWGQGDGKQIACLPWEIDANEDAFYSVQAQVWMPEKSDNPNVTNQIGLGYMDNSDFSQDSLAAGRGALWLELYYSDDQSEGEHDAHYRVLAKDTGGTVELYDSAAESKTVDLSEGFATVEVAWKTSSQLNWRMYGAAVVDALGNAEYIAATPDGMINGPLMDFDNEGGFTVDGIGFEMPGSGGMITGFHAVPEPGTLALLSIAGLALAATAWTRRRRAA